MRLLLTLTAIHLLAACKPSPTASQACATNDDCKDGLVCVRAECVDPGGAACNDRTGCTDGLHCCSGVCTLGNCCVADFECPEGYCEASACRAGTRPACSETEPCVSGRCLQSVGLCYECIYSDDCPTTDLICSPNHTCIPATAGCTVASCADQGLICAPEQGACRPCLSTAECGDRICSEDGTCRACTGSESCGTGRSCSNGRCTNDAGTACTTSADCGNQYCNPSTHRCTPCALPSECGSGRTCLSGVCVADDPDCSTDGDCNPPSIICRAQRCEPGCTEVSCASGQICSPTTGRCIVTSTGTLALGQACSSHEACISNVCWPTLDESDQVQLSCSQSCIRHDDCPSNFVCYELGDGNLCVPKSLFPGLPLNVVPGQSCSGTFINTQCMTGYCNTTTQKCMETCGRDADCYDLGTQLACVSRWPVGSDTNGDNMLSRDETLSLTQLCHVPYGSLAINAPCTAHDDCGSGYCAQTPDYTLETRCAAPCCSPLDCDPSRPVCKPLWAWDGVREQAGELPYSFQKVCLWAEYGGQRNVGELCNSDAECKSEICVAGPSGQKRCTHTCCTNRECADYDWALSCRPPFVGDHSVADTNFLEITRSLGRKSSSTAITTPIDAITTLCMPR